MDEASLCRFEFDGGRICSICGAKALGYNFGVISCESCKAFFRRNAFKEEQGVTCPFTNNCAINEKSRRYCQACRLKKCYAVGMKRDWTSQLKVKSVKEEIEDENVIRKRMRDTVQQPALGPPTDPRPPPSLPSLPSLPSSLPHSIFPASPNIPVPGVGLSDQVTISKELFAQLLNQAKPKTECTCNCRCGFYSPETKLVAKKEQKITPTVPSLGSILGGQLSAAGLDAFSPLMASAPSLDLLPSSSMTGMWTPPISWSESLAHLSAPSSNNGVSSAAPSCYAPSPLVQNPSSVQSIPPLDVVPLTPQTIDKSPAEPDNEFSKNFANIGRNPAVYEKLTMDHRSLLIELLKANESLRMPLANLKREVYTLLDAVKCADIAVRRMIMMAKNLKTFNDLPNSDQMTLIKGGAVEILILRGAMIYDPHNRSWKYELKQNASEDPFPIQMEMSLDILKGSEHFIAHQKFLATFDDRIRTNEVLMVVIHALLLFSPREGLSDIEAVRKAHDKYHELILRILECEFSPSTSREMLTRIENVINQLKSLNSSMIEVVYGIDSSHIDPLIVEVFGLKPKNSP